jgi:hypothetical protein
MGPRRLLVKFCKSACEWPTGFDTTGRKLSVPPGQLCIHEQLAKDYINGGYVVKSAQIGEYSVTLVDLVATYQKTQEFHKKEESNDATIRRSTRKTRVTHQSGAT